MIVIINGGSGAGKTHLLQQLLKQNDNEIVPIKKYTTRVSRDFEDENESVDLVYNCDRKYIENFKYNYPYKGEHYGINSNELTDMINKNKVPVVIIRSFKTIREIKEDFQDVIVLFVVGETGEKLNEILVSQGRDEKEIKKIADSNNKIIKEYIENIDLVDECLVNCLYVSELYLKQFYYFVKEKYRKE